LNARRKQALGALGLVSFLSAAYFFLVEDGSAPAHPAAGETTRAARPADDLPSSEMEVAPAAKTPPTDPADEARLALAIDGTDPSAPRGWTAPPGALRGEENPEALARLAPRSKETLDQARENPHQTPPSLIEFAHQLAGPMERAMKSEAEARPVFAQMESCAGDHGGNQAIQARVVCMANAARLAELFPTALGARYQALLRKNPSIAAILETTGL
jgi:hypothetical protein